MDTNVVEGDLLIQPPAEGGALMLPFEGAGPLVPAVIYGKPDGLRVVIDKLKEAVLAEKRDISTPKARDELKRLGRKIASSRIALDNMGKEVKAEYLAKSNAIDLPRREMRKELEEFEAQILKPLTDWENEEAERIRGHESALLEMRDLAVFAMAPTLQEIDDHLAALHDKLKGRSWREFQGRAEDMLQEVTDQLQAARVSEVERLQQVEADRLAAEEAARVADEARRAREAEIAAEAARRAREEAERVAREAARIEAQRVEAERLAAERAEQERAEAAARVLREAEEKAEQDRQDAARREREAAQREADLKRQAEEAEALRVKQALDAEAAAQKAARDAELAAEESKRRADAAAERARQEERQRREDEAARERAETEAREKNKAHRAKINGAVLAAILPVIVPGQTAEEIAKAVVITLAKGHVPHVKVEY